MDLSGVIQHGEAFNMSKRCRCLPVLLSFLFILFLLLPSFASADEVYYFDPSNEHTYPCRLLDTRNIGGVGTGPKIEPGTYYDVNVRGFFGADQGGETDCGVPLTATGAVYSIVAVAPEGSGYVRVYKWSGIEPLTATLTVISGDTRNDGAVTPLAQFEGDYDWTLHVVGPRLHIVIDLVGYTAKPDSQAMRTTITSITQACSGCKTYLGTSSGLSVTCDQPYTDPDFCADELAVNDCIDTKGHIEVEDGVNYLAAHGVSLCPSP